VVALATLGFAAPCLLAQAPSQVGGDEAVIVVALETEFGTITAELYPDRAPVTVENFLRHLEAGYYQDAIFHRSVRPDNQPDDSVRISVIQGMPDPHHHEGPPFDPIPLERTSETGLRHLDGALSMARFDPDSATWSFFICIDDQPELDYGGARNPDGQGFAAFGQVIDGMDLVRRINGSAVEAQALTPPIRILRVVRLE
jgi:peptidyl-prolyl cis-trans isomerase A (cyclophilin A)